MIESTEGKQRNKKEKPFDAHAEALKFLAQDEERMDKMIQVKSEHTKRGGTRICVNMKDGSKRVFFYVEGGMFKGWNPE